MKIFSAAISHTMRVARQRVGFTLIELLVVIAILAAGLLPRPANAQTNANPTRSDLPAGLAPDCKLVWSEDFNGDSLDTNRWSYRTDSKNLSTQKPENVSVTNGMLRLTLKREAAGGKAYTGAGIISKPAFKYGYYEARIKIPPGAGWHSAFWLMKHDGSGTTDAGEAAQGLDIFANNSIDPLSYRLDVRVYNPEPGGVFGASTVTTPDLSADFHVVGCEFTPETVKFFFDGEAVQTVDATHFPQGEQNIWVTSIASHMGNTQAVDDSKLPAVVECDYVRFYAKTNVSGQAP